MKNKKVIFRISMVLLISLLLSVLTSCSIPFIGGSKKDAAKSNTTSNKSGNEKSSDTSLKTQPLPDEWSKKNGSANGSDSQMQDTTLPGSVLNPGETWKENGSELTLSDVSLVNGKIQGVLFSITYKNKKGNQIAFDYIPKTSINVMDNLNSIKKVIGYSNDMSYSNANFDEVKITQLVENNEEANLSGTYPCFAARFNIGDAKINEILITVTNISNIKKAQWKIPVYH